MQRTKQTNINITYCPSETSQHGRSRTARSTQYVPPPALPNVAGYDIAVIGGWESPYYWRLARQLRACDTPVILFYESTTASHRFSSGPVARLRRRFFKSADAVVTVGSASSEAVAAMGVHPSRIYQSFNSVDVAWFHEAAAARRKPPDASHPGHRFVFVGQLIPRKNVATLIQAFAHEREPGDTLTIAGSGVLRAELEALATRLHVDQAVSFAGALEQGQIAGVYAESDTLVLPSTQEVWGLVANEGLAAGLHTVVSSASGVAPDIREMRGVFVVEPRLASIADGMRRSRASWRGPIARPEILERGATGLADSITKAIQKLGAAGLVKPEPSTPRILWLTNIPVPYRIQTWRTLAATADLSVAFMALS